MNRAWYKIAGITICLETPFEVSDSDGFVLYRYEPAANEEPDTLAVWEPCESFPEPAGEVLFRDMLHQVYERETNGYRHFFSIPFDREFAAWTDLNGESKKIRMYYNPAKEGYFCQSFACFNALGIERILYGQKKFLFHCSYVEYQGKAILFSAPSGGGKTTQGTLWEKYVPEAVMVNGDRAVLEVCDGQVICHGLPIAGSSGVFLNRSMPLAGIFVVKKAGVNRVTPRVGMEAFQSVYSELTLNMWNQDFVGDALDFADAVIEAVPVYTLECTISEEAVSAVKEVL